MKPTYAWVAIVVLAIAAALGWGGYLNELSSTKDSSQVTSEIVSSPASEQVSTETAAQVQKLEKQNKSLAAANESLTVENQALKKLRDGSFDIANVSDEELAVMRDIIDELGWSPSPIVTELKEQNQALAAANESLTVENQALKKLRDGSFDIANATDEELAVMRDIIDELGWSPSPIVVELKEQNQALAAANENLTVENQALKKLRDGSFDIANVTDEELAVMRDLVDELGWSPSPIVVELKEQIKSLAAINEKLILENRFLAKLKLSDGILDFDNMTDEALDALRDIVESWHGSLSTNQITTQPQSEEQIAGNNTEMAVDATDAASDSTSGETNEASQSISSMALKVSEALVKENQKFRAAQNELEEVNSQLMESEARRVVLETKLSLLDEQNRQVVQSLGNVLDEHEVVSEQASAAPVLEDIARQLAEIDDEPAATASEPKEVGERVTEVIDHLQVLRQEKGDLQEQLSSAQNQLTRSEQQNDYLAKRLEYASKHLRRIRFKIRSEEERSQGLSDALSEIQRKLSEDVAQLQTEITSLKTGMSGIRLGTDILFASGSAELTAEGENALRIFNQELENYRDAIISVEGHTDNKPIKSTIADKYPTNWELSAARAASAVRYLVELGVPAERIRAIGHGESNPANSNDTEQGRSKNRRIELVVHLPPNLSG